MIRVKRIGVVHEVYHRATQVRYDELTHEKRLAKLMHLATQFQKL